MLRLLMAHQVVFATEVAVAAGVRASVGAFSLVHGADVYFKIVRTGET